MKFSDGFLIVQFVGTVPKIKVDFQADLFGMKHKCHLGYFTKANIFFRLIYRITDYTKVIFEI